MAKVKFATSHGKGRSFLGSGAEVINAYAQKADDDAEDFAWLVGGPGSEVFASFDTDTETVLQTVAAFDRIVAFTTGGIYVVDEMGSTTRLSDPIAGPISAAYNGQVVVAVNGSAAIVMDQNTVQSIVDPDFQPATTVQYLGGFFVFTRTDSGQYFVSEVFSTDFDALDFATAESAPDDLISVVSVRRELWLLGEDTVEVHALSGGADFPFSPLSGVSINFGCVAPFSALAVDQSVFWLSPDGIVYQSIGYEARRVTTHEIEEELELVRDEWVNARAWTYIETGHQFYVLTVGEQTFCFDVATREWHKRQTFGMTRHFAMSCSTAFRKVIVGDERGRLLHLSRDFTTDPFGDVVVVIGSVPYANDKFFTTNKLQIQVEVGQGAEATLEYADDDDGKVWSNRLAVSKGVLGEHDRIVEWRRLGRARSKRFRLRVYGPGRKRIGVSANLEAS